MGLPYWAPPATNRRGFFLTRDSKRETIRRPQTAGFPTMESEMAFTLDIDVVGRDAGKVADLLRAVADRLEAGETEGEIVDGDEACGAFALEEDAIGQAEPEPLDPADEPHDPDLKG